MTESQKEYWKRVALSDMSAAEWDALCDRCGKCCLHKLQEQDTGALYYTDVACVLLDLETGQCRDYENRQETVPDCVKLTSERLCDIAWLPTTCAYEILFRGDDLPSWHPLRTGRFDSVAQAGMSVVGRAVPEDAAGHLEDHIVDWDDL